MIQATAQTQSDNNTGINMSAISMPRLLLHLEGAAFFTAAVALYAQHSGDWLFFIVLLLVPDMAMVGYLMNKKIGAMVYNLVHTYTTPLLVIAAGLTLTQPLIISIGLILLAHNGMDRIFGYGLKYDTAFKDTHMGRV